MLKFDVSPCCHTDIGEQLRTQGLPYETLFQGSVTLHKLLFFSVTSGLVPDALSCKVHVARANSKPIRLWRIPTFSGGFYKSAALTDLLRSKFAFITH